MQKPAVETSKNLEKARRLYLTKEEGIADSEMAGILGVSHRTANRYRITLKGRETFQNSAKYTLKPSKEEIEFAKALLQREGFSVEKAHKDKKELEKQLRKEEIAQREELITDDY